MDYPFFSIIVPTYRRNHDLEKCLHALSPSQQLNMQLWQPDMPDSNKGVSYEVIVADDDGSAKALMDREFPWVIYVRSLSKGPAANRNYASTYAKGKWIIFIDDDCVAVNEYLNAYRNCTQKLNTDVKAIEGCIIPTGVPGKELEQSIVNKTGGCFWSANIAIEKDFFNAIGKFDECFKKACSEDEDLYYRIRNQTTVLFLKEAIVYHPIRRWTLMGRMQYEISMTSSRAYLKAKHLHYKGVYGFFKTVAYDYLMSAITICNKVRSLQFKAFLLAFFMMFVVLPYQHACYLYFRIYYWWNSLWIGAEN